MTVKLHREVKFVGLGLLKHYTERISIGEPALNVASGDGSLASHVVKTLHRFTSLIIKCSNLNVLA